MHEKQLPVTELKIRLHPRQPASSFSIQWCSALALHHQNTAKWRDRKENAIQATDDVIIGRY